MKTFFLLIMAILCAVSTDAQVYINRNLAIENTEIFGLARDISRGLPLRAGMYIETTGNNNAQPFYGYTMDGQIKAYQYYAGGDDGLHFFNSSLKMSLWADSMQWKINPDLRLFYNGYKLELGDQGNTFIGKGVTPSISTTNVANTVVGWLGGMNMEGGVNNTLIGFKSGQLVSSGDWNTIVGSEAANTLTTGYRNTIIGYRAGWNGGANGFGNILIGNRAGEGQVINNKLIISNSETTAPLIVGDFANPELKINGTARITGEAHIDGIAVINDNANIFGDVGITGTTYSGALNLTGANPFLYFKPSGTSKFYIQYNQIDDELNVHRTSLGDVIKIKNDGSIYIPELGTSEKAMVEVMPDGKLVIKTYPTVYEYFKFEELNSPFSGTSNYNLIPAKELNNGDIITQMVVRSAWNSDLIPNPTEVHLYRWNKFNGSLEPIATISNLGTGPYNQEFSIAMNHTVNTSSYTYFIFAKNDSSYTYVRLRR